MASSEPGVVVPIPTFPLAKTVRRVDVEIPPVVEAMVKSGMSAAVLRLLLMERSEYGEVVPMPRLVPSKIKFELLANPEPSKYSTPFVVPPVVVPVPPFATGSATPLYETANVPSDVIGDPETERKEGTDIPMEVIPELTPPLTIMAPPPVAEIIGFCGVPVIEMFVPAVSDLIMFDANTRPNPRLISVLLVSMPPNVCRRPLNTEDPDTRNAPLIVAEAFILRRVALDALCVLLIFLMEGNVKLFVLVA